MSIQSDDLTRANAIRIELNSRPRLVPEYDAVQMESFDLYRDEDGYLTYEIVPDPYDEEPVAIPCPMRSSSDSPMGAAEAWDWINELHIKESALIMIGPGDGPVTLESPTFLPDHWQVWEVAGDDIAVHVGSYVHRLSAMRAAKSVIRAGRCPIIATPYVPTDSEWDCDEIIQSTEVSDASIGGR